jgi:hypothetical protein
MTTDGKRIKLPAKLRPGQAVEMTLPCGSQVVIESGSSDGHPAVILDAPKGAKVKRRSKCLDPAKLTP